VPRPQARRLSTPSVVSNLQPPQPIIPKQSINNSRATLPPYSSPNSSTATLVEKQYNRESSQRPPQGPPQGLPEQSPKDGPPPPDLGVKILEGWALGLTVFT
jgi:hypothetical protein